MLSRTNWLSGSLTFILLLIVLAGCERASMVVEEMPDEATLSNIQSSIFNTSCAFSSCHGGNDPQQGMSLEAGKAFSNIVNVDSKERPDLKRVAPGNPEGSYLLKKVRGDADIVNGRMPLGRSALSNEQIDLIRRWIEDGALDN